MANTVSIAPATGTVTIAVNPIATETVVVGNVTYTFVAAPASANDIDIGADAAASLSNLRAAILDIGVEGTDYGTGTVRNPYVGEATISGTVLTLTAAVPGLAGNHIPLSETMAGAGNVVAAFASGSGDMKLWLDDLFNLNQINAEVMFELKKLTGVAD